MPFRRSPPSVLPTGRKRLVRKSKKEMLQMVRRVRTKQDWKVKIRQRVATTTKSQRVPSEWISNSKKRAKMVRKMPLHLINRINLSKSMETSS